MHVSIKNTASSGQQQVSPEAPSSCNDDLNTDIEKLIKTFTLSLEQLTVLPQAQAQIATQKTFDVQPKRPASLMPGDVREYFKPKGAAEYINSSTSTLAKRRLYGGGPKFTRIGRAIRYAKSDLDAFMAANTVSSTSEKVG
jgi:hypothetical protein